MTIEFTPEELQEIEKLKAKYPDAKAAVMPVLWLAQKKFGWISTQVMELVGKTLDLPYSHVYGVATFYTMYFKKPMGKYHIQVCTNVSCMLRDGEKIYKHVLDELNLNNLETTEDGMFSIEEVECMGACGGAPMIAINEDYHENVDINKVDELISSLKK